MMLSLVDWKEVKAERGLAINFPTHLGLEVY
jgi:hypothetical protein